MFVSWNIFLNFLAAGTFLFLCANFFKIKNKKMNNVFYLKYLIKNNIFSNFFCVYVILILSYFIEMVLFLLLKLRAISEKNERKKYEIFSLFTIDKKFILQEFRTVLSEFFLIIMFYERQFSFFSAFFYVFFIFFKNICIFYINKIKNLQNTHEEFSVKNRLKLIVISIAMLQTQILACNIVLKFYHQRIVNGIIGLEILYLSLNLKTMIISRLFMMFDENFFNKKWISIENCEFYQKIVLSLLGIFFHMIMDRNVSISRKTIFRYYTIRKILEYSKNLFLDSEEFFRYKKTSISIENFIKTVTDKDMPSISDKICVVCRNDNKTIISKILPCHHTFHSKCLRTWLQKQYCCPTCLKPISSNGLNFFFAIDESIDFLKSKKKKLNTTLFSLGYSRSVQIDKKNKVVFEISQIRPQINPNLMGVLFCFVFNKKNSTLNTRKRIKQLFKITRIMKLALGDYFFYSKK